MLNKKSAKKRSAPAPSENVASALEEEGAQRGEEDEQVTVAGRDPETFEDLGLSKPLCETVQQLQWKAPTDIQKQAIPVALELGTAATAFSNAVALALLDRPQALFACVLAPTRELALQIAEQFEALGAIIGLKCAVVVGGVDMMQQAIALAKRPHVVVGTPGRLMDHLTNTKGFSLRSLRFLVLDEADRLLNMDFEQEIDQLLKVFRDKCVGAALVDFSQRVQSGLLL
eukprot:scaffold626_cov409-Prasinococcus_capsulatus_cf.AAC.5